MKSGFKTLIASVLVFTMIGSTALSAASPAEEKPINEQQFSKVNDVVFQGQKIGTQEVSITYNRDVSSEGTTVNLHTETTYNFEPSTSEEVRELFKNTSKDDVIQENKNKEYFLNGEQITNETSSLIQNTPVGSQSVPAPFSSQDSGGKPSLCHYYGDYSVYSYACYSGMNLDSTANGSHVQKNSVPFSNAYTNRAQQTIDVFGADWMNLQAAQLAFVTATGVAILGIATILAFIAGGVGAVSAAVVVLTTFNTCNSDLEKAYGYISQM
ncbi:hypothetical protein [Paenibacillus chitinolyticus]|uniref:hypothetical protein n=1 Tax=Paenibacillus chitinolyticus TaxID=79263 RepID=UPI003CFCF00B